MVVLHVAERRDRAPPRSSAPTSPTASTRCSMRSSPPGIVLDPSNNVRQGVAGRARLRPGLEARRSCTPNSSTWSIRCAASGDADQPRSSTLARGPVRRGAGPPARARRPARHPFRAAARRGPHRGAPPRRGAPRLRGQHQPRAEDPDRRREPARRGPRLGGGRAGAGAAFRQPALDRVEPPRRTSRSEIIELSGCRRADALAHAELIDIDQVVAAGDRPEPGRGRREAHRIDQRCATRTTREVYGDETLLVIAVHNLIANAIAVLATTARASASA